MYSIGEFSEVTGISIYTLRYYEKEGLVIPHREANGRRCYSDNDLSWIEFIKRLKETRMPIKEIQQYARLRALGDSTLQARMQMLVLHDKHLKAEMKKMKENIRSLEQKIAYYRSQIEQKTKREKA